VGPEPSFGRRRDDPRRGVSEMVRKSGGLAGRWPMSDTSPLWTASETPRRAAVAPADSGSVISQGSPSRRTSRREGLGHARIPANRRRAGRDQPPRSRPRSAAHPHHHPHKLLIRSRVSDVDADPAGSAP
jgi:hypothetical protein